MLESKIRLIFTAITKPSDEWKLIYKSSFIILLSWLSFFYISKFIPQELAFGCDEFGYLLQARLFREHSFFGALETSMTMPQHFLLQDYLLKNFPNPDSWFNVVGPHCFHYETVSGKTVLQYPPGVGFLLSLFRPGEALQIFSILTAGLMIVLSAQISIRTKSFFKIGAVFAANFCVMRAIVEIQVPGYSILLFTTIFAIFYNLIIAFHYKDIEFLRVILTGLTVGTISAVRLPAIFVIPLFFLVSTYRLSNFKVLHYFVIAMIASFILVPVALYNSINAGHFWLSTYPKYDKDISMSLITFISNSKYYFIENSLFYIYIGMLVSFVYSVYKLNKFWVTIIASTFIFNLAFYLAKPVVINYYLLPLALPMIYLSLYLFTEDENN